MAIECGGCSSVWSGVTRAHCAGCHETFLSVTGFEQHRHYGVCKHPSERGMNSFGGYWRLNTEVEAMSLV